MNIPPSAVYRMPKPNWKLNWLATAICFAIATPCYAAVNDVFPADYAVLPEGVSTASLYYFDRTLIGPYSDGHNLRHWKINASIVALRLTHSMKVAGLAFSPMLTVPYADSEMTGARIPATIDRSSAGMADSRIGGTLWLYNDVPLRRYLAVNATLVMPTGSYDADAFLNIGENRYQCVLNLGWIHGFGDNITLEITPEIVWYGDNTSYQGSKHLEQAPTYALTSYLRYKFNPQWQAFAGYQSNQGGETRVNSVAMNNATDSDRLYLGGTYRFTPSVSVNFRYTQALNYVNGFVLRDELALRINKVF